MATTISKAIGEGFDKNAIYAALAYDSTDKFGGYEIKSVMLNTTYKLYFRDVSQYIYSSTDNQLDLVATTVAITGNLTVSGSITYGATAVPVATSYMGTLTVGIDDTGYDVKFYGATSGYYFLWDESADGVVLVGTFTETGNMAVTGTFTLTGAPTITGDMTLIGTLTIGEDGTGHDITIYGETASYRILWDENGDTNGALYIGQDQYGIMFNLYGDTTGCGVFWNPSTDTNGTLSVGASGGSKGNDFVAYGTTNGKYFKWDQSADGVVLVGSLSMTGDTSQTGNVGLVGTLTVGVDATGHDVKFYGETTGYYWLWDQNADTNGGVVIVGTMTQTGNYTVTGSIAITSGDIDLSASTTGTYDITLKANQADALSIKDSTGDLMVFTTTTDALAIAIAAILNVSGVTNFTGNVNFGVDGTGVDVKLFGDTASSYCLWDMSDDRLELDGADINVQDGDFIQFGDSQDIFMNFDGTNFEIEGAAAATTVLWGADSKLLNTTWKGTLTVGKDGTSHDVKFFGDTSGAYILWDESDDRLEFVNAFMELGTSASPTAVTYDGKQVLQIYTTCASTTDTGFQQQIIKNVMTGAGQSVEGLGVELESNVKLGTYANALCARVDWQTNGGVAGLGSVICAEMIMGAGAMNGTFGILECEVSCPTGWTGTGPVSYLYCNSYGNTKANFDTYGNLINIDGATANTGKMICTGDTAPATVGGTIRIRIGGTPYYLIFYTSEATTT